jgi:heptosyltransferase-2
MHPRKILIRGPNWVGDAVLAIPALKALRSRFPEAETTLLVRPWVSGLFSEAPFIDRVWSAPRPAGLADWKRLTGEIRAQEYDLAVLLPNSFESALMMFLGRVPHRLGYATDGRAWMLTNPVIPGDEIRHQIFYYLDLVKTISATVERPSIEIQATSGERSDARRLLAAEGIGAGKPFMVLNPGAAYGSAKRWYEERFAAVGDALARDLGLAIVIVGSLNERPIAAEIQSLTRSNTAVLSGKTSLETLIGVLAEASLMITNDSGPMHIAAAVGTPTIAVFGPTDDRVTSPYGPRTRVVKHAVECSPCLLRECPIDHRCMQGVSVENVYRAARELVGKMGT